jgi:hypothetical protein
MSPGLPRGQLSECGELWPDDLDGRAPVLRFKKKFLAATFPRSYPNVKLSDQIGKKASSAVSGPPEENTWSPAVKV